MFPSILHRKILTELVKVFALSLLGITAILVLAGIVAEASQQGLKPNQLLFVIPLLVPSFMPYTIPATTLFAACVVYGRLAHDNEILAIKAAGVNILRVVSPGVVLGLAMTLVTMGLYYDLIPRTTQLLRSRFLNNVEEFLYDMLRVDRCIKRPNIPYVMWVRQVQGTRLIDALFKRLDPRTHRYDIIAKAREAELHVDMNTQVVEVHMKHGQVLREDGMEQLSFESKVWEVPLPPDLSKEARPKIRGLSWPQLLERRRQAAAEEEEFRVAIEEEKKHTPDPPPGDSPLYHLTNKKKERHQEVLSLDTEMNMRPALSFGCLCFVLVGCPVGIWLSKSDYLSAFITCFLPIVFIYYPLLLCSSNLARQGYLPAVLWAANGMMGLAGLVLFRRLLRH